MIRVLNVIDSLGAGGAESLLNRFLKEARNNSQFSVDVCTLYPGGIFEFELVHAGLVALSANCAFKYDFTGILRLIKIIRKGKYDIVHVHLFPADLFVAIVSLFLPRNIKFIFSEHNVYNRRRSIKLYKVIDRFVYSRYCRIICVSEMVKYELDKYLPEVADKSIVIKNAVEVEDFEETRDKEYDIIFVGRLERAKGVDVLLKAIQILEKNRSVALRVAIVGDGSQVGYLRRITQDLEIRSRVEFLGIRQDISQLMRNSKVFVLPSRWEGLPMVILEAMANKVPIIATSVGGIPEIISDGVTGLLVKTDDPEELAEKVRMLLDDSSLRKRLSISAFEKVKSEYSIKEYCTNVLRLYDEVLRS